MAAKTVMFDELTGVAITLNDDETTELMTVIVNGYEVLIPQEQHNSLYEVASRLEDMIRDIKLDLVEQGKAPNGYTKKHSDFNEAVHTFTEKRD